MIEDIKEINLMDLFKSRIQSVEDSEKDPIILREKLKIIVSDPIFRCDLDD